MKTRRILLELVNKFDGNEGCFIRGCEAESGVEMAVVKPFDPIDHEDIYLMVCEEHMDWAERRNALAEEIYADFREYRREIGAEYADQVNAIDDPEFEEIDTKSVLRQLGSEV